MADVQFSEFTYGYALLADLENNKGGFKNAPIVLSTRREGHRGYDAETRFRDGTVWFLQFKIPQLLTTGRAWEIRDDHLFFRPPFYRMHLRLGGRRQHELLISLEKDVSPENTVYYSTPAFHTNDNLNLYFVQRGIEENSLMVQPSEIGRFRDRNNHHIAYQNTEEFWVCSKEKPSPKKAGHEKFIASIKKDLTEKPGTAIDVRYLDFLRSTISEIAKPWVRFLPELYGRYFCNYFENDELASVYGDLGFLSQFALGCSLIVAYPSDDNSYSRVEFLRR